MRRLRPVARDPSRHWDGCHKGIGDRASRRAISADLASQDTRTAEFRPGRSSRLSRWASNLSGPVASLARPLQEIGCGYRTSNDLVTAAGKGKGLREQSKDPPGSPAVEQFAAAAGEPRPKYSVQPNHHILDMVTSGLDHKRRDVWTAPPLAQRYISRSKMRQTRCQCSVCGFFSGHHDLKAVASSQAQPAYHLRQSASFLRA